MFNNPTPFMLMKAFLTFFAISLICLPSHGQFNFDKQIKSNVKYSENIIDEVYGITLYEPLNLGISADSVRMEDGYAVNNWKEDYYENGQLLHRGYYIEGQLKVYKNYYPDGTLERDFKNIDGFRSKCALYYPSGKIKSEIIYLNGSPISWTDYYDNGNMEYMEEFDKNFLYHIAKKSYYKSGQLETLFELISKKKLQFSTYEYYLNGSKKMEGTLRYDMSRYDYYKIGTWIYYNEAGDETKQETYSEGKVIKTKKF